MKLRVLTYNIHKCIGGIDRQYWPERIAQVIEQQNPDVALLQEVDSGVPRSNQDHQVDWLGERLEYRHRAFQPNVTVGNGCYGNAILSRYPIENRCDIDLTMRLKKARRCLVAGIRLPDNRLLNAACLHLGLAGFERKWQLRKLLKTLGSTSGNSMNGPPLVVGGDFNDVWLSLGRVMRAASFSEAGRHRTFPATIPVIPLDRVFYRGPVRCVSSFSPQESPVRGASDHRPIVAEFLVDDASGQ